MTGKGILSNILVYVGVVATLAALLIVPLLLVFGFIIAWPIWTPFGVAALLIAFLLAVGLTAFLKLLGVLRSGGAKS